MVLIIWIFTPICHSSFMQSTSLVHWLCRNCLVIVETSKVSNVINRLFASIFSFWCWILQNTHFETCCMISTSNFRQVSVTSMFRLSLVYCALKHPSAIDCTILNENASFYPNKITLFNRWSSIYDANFLRLP